MDSVTNRFLCTEEHVCVCVWGGGGGGGGEMQVL